MTVIQAHILLVEDNSTDVELTLDAFREVRLDGIIHVVHNGQDALDYLFTRANANTTPDLILLDLKLPGGGGLAVLSRVKSTPILKRVPVIVLTSSQQEADLARCYDNGANIYLIKPTSFYALIETVWQIDAYWLALNSASPA